ncbi:MAG: hypothetical protein JXQ87_02785 [Bacteroidia bacterium]
MSQLLNPIAVLLKENQSVKSLSFRNRRLEQLPVDLTAFPNLEQLDLSGNNLRTLSENISRLKNLKVLNVSENPRLNLSQLFYVLAECPKLEKLNISNNNIEELPTELCYLDNLKKLVLDQNPVNPFTNRNMMNLPENLNFISVKDCAEGSVDQRLKKFEGLRQIQTTSYNYETIQQIHFLLPKATVLIQ